MAGKDFLVRLGSNHGKVSYSISNGTNCLELLATGSAVAPWDNLIQLEDFPWPLCPGA